MTTEEREAIELALKTYCDAGNYPMYVASHIGDKDVMRFVGKLVAYVLDQVHNEFKHIGEGDESNV